MNFKSILVHLDDSDRCAARVNLAAQLAGTHGSHLIGLLPTGLYESLVPADVIPTGVTDDIAEVAERLRRRADSIDDAFRALMSGQGRLSYEVRRVDGSALASIVDHGRTSDLIVLGQDEPSRASGAPPQGLVPPVMLEAGRPVLVVPYAGRFETAGKTILVAWDGSRESAVAMRMALPFLSKADQVALVSFSGAEEPADPARLLVAEMSQWLQRHDILATAEQRVTEIDISDALLSHAADMGADLIVMGGYGHSRLRELILGGVTRQVLASMTVPVLMAH